MIFGNIKCVFCNEYINPIELKEHSIKCELQQEIDRLKNTMQWISVKDRLPDKEENVLFFDGDMIYIGGIGSYEEGYEEGGKIIDFWIDFPQESIDFEWNDITHWMPLPSSPVNK